AHAPHHSADSSAQRFSSRWPDDDDTDGALRDRDGERNLWTHAATQVADDDEGVVAGGNCFRANSECARATLRRGGKIAAQFETAGDDRIGGGSYRCFTGGSTRRFHRATLASVPACPTLRKISSRSHARSR